MGVDFSHCDVRWGYRGFHIFRCKIAQGAGINLGEMEGFKDVGGKSWSDIKDSIKIFLNHSDCDGYLTALQCEKVSQRLREIVKLWDDSDIDKMKALELAQGMQAAYEADEQFEFE